MVKPAVWSDAERKEWWYDENGEENGLGCGTVVQQQTLEPTEFKNHEGYDEDCLQWWLSNRAEIPGNVTIPYEVSQPGADCEFMGTSDEKDKYPWSAPGTAPIFSPCGVMGGNPYGCGGATNFGDTCPCAWDDAGKHTCSIFAFGRGAETYEWPNAPTTEWKVGTVEEVVLYVMSFANHAGGYSFRLCKTPEGGISDLTEECFQKGHLDFSGDTQLVEYHGDRFSGYKTEFVANRTNEGTFPPGSMWTAIPLIPQSFKDIDCLNYVEAGGSFLDCYHDYYFGHIIDNIEVPTSLEPGDYVLSSRWDTKCTPEVFSFCANIRITN